MDALPILISLLREISARRWVRVLVYIGIGSFVLFAVTGLGCLFTYMRASYDCEVKIQVERDKIQVERDRLFADVHKVAIEKAALEGEIHGYQLVIAAFAKKGRRKSLGIFTVTAYDPKGCEPFNDGFTSIGLPVGDGIFAVNPKKIPYGALLYIPEIAKYGIAGDTGAAMRADPESLDVFIPIRKDALAFGRQKLELQLVEFD